MGAGRPLREAWSTFPVVVAGNTVASEEELVIAAWRAARVQVPGLRLILAPRQPRRFDAVAGLLMDQGLEFRRASVDWPESAVWSTVDVLLLDTLGELAAAYVEGTVALVAGGWAAGGGHNPLEPVRVGVPVLLGPGFANFEDLVPPLRDAGLLRVVEAPDLARALVEALASAPLRSSGQAPLPEALQGALDRTLGLLAPFLSLRAEVPAAPATF